MSATAKKGFFDPANVARPVVHLGGGHELAALLQAGDHGRLEVGTRRINGGGVAGGTADQDQRAAVAWMTLELFQWPTT